MADLLCRKCLEPWDADEIHELVSERHQEAEWLTDGRYDQAKYDPLYREAFNDFRKRGCEAFGAKHSEGEAVAAVDLMRPDEKDEAVAAGFAPAQLIDTEEERCSQRSMGERCVLSADHRGEHEVDPR